jgi:hypothetical protein
VAALKGKGKGTTTRGVEGRREGEREKQRKGKRAMMAETKNSRVQARMLQDRRGTGGGREERRREEEEEEKKKSSAREGKAVCTRGHRKAAAQCAHGRLLALGAAATIAVVISP